MHSNWGSPIKWIVGLIAAVMVVGGGWWGYSLWERSLPQSTGWQTANEEMKQLLHKQSEDKQKKSDSLKESGKHAAPPLKPGTDKNGSSAPSTQTSQAEADAKKEQSPAIEADRQHAAGQIRAEAAPAVTMPDQELPVAKPALTKGKIKLNKATQAQLVTIPGIGESKAKAIIAYRNQIGEFQQIDQLLDVKGIGEKLLEKMRPFLVLESG